MMVTPRWLHSSSTAVDLSSTAPPAAYNYDDDDSKHEYEHDDGNDHAAAVVQQHSRVNKTASQLVARQANRRAAAFWKATASPPSILTQRSNFNNNFDVSSAQQRAGTNNQDVDENSIKVENDYILSTIDKSNNIPADYYYYHNNDDEVSANQSPAPPRRTQNSARDNNNVDDFTSSYGDDEGPNVWPFDTRQTRPPLSQPATPPSTAFIATFDSADNRVRDDGEADDSFWVDLPNNKNAFTTVMMENSQNFLTSTASTVMRANSTVFNFAGTSYGGNAASTFAVSYPQHNQNITSMYNASLTTSPQPSLMSSSPSSADFWPSQQQLPSSLLSSSSPLSSTVPPTSFQAVTLLYGIPMILIAIGTICGNILICAAVGNSRHLRRSITNYFVVSLAIADLLLGICVLPVSATRSILGYFPFGPLFCNLYVGTDVFLSTASILNLFMVSIDRYFAITTPLRYYDVVTQSRAYLALTFVWLSSALTGYLPIYLGWNTHDGVTQNTGAKYVAGECSFPVENAWYSSSIGLGTFFVPLAVLYVMYSHILRISYGHVRAIKKQIAMMAQFQECTSKMTVPPSSSIPAKSSSNVNLSTAAAQQKANNHQKSPSSSNNAASSVTNNTLRQHRATLTLFIIVGAFSLCWIPYFVCFTLRSLNIAFFRPSEAVDDMFLWMGYFNSFVNPFIYGMTNREYRNAFKSMLRVAWTQLVKVCCCVCHFTSSRRKKQSANNENSLNNSYDHTYNSTTAVPRGRAATVNSTSNQNFTTNGRLKSCLKSNVAPSFLRPNAALSRNNSNNSATAAAPITPSIKMEPSRSFPHRYANTGLRPDLFDFGNQRRSLSRRSTDISNGARGIVLDNLLKEAAADVSDEFSLPLLTSVAADVNLPLLKKSPSSNSHYDNVIEDGGVRPTRIIVAPNNVQDVSPDPISTKTGTEKVVTLNRKKSKQYSGHENGHVKNYEMCTDKVSLLTDHSVKHRFPIELDNNGSLLTRVNEREDAKAIPSLPESARYGTQV